MISFSFEKKNSEEESGKGHHDEASEEGEYEEKKGHEKKHFDESG